MALAPEHRQPHRVKWDTPVFCVLRAGGFLQAHVSRVLSPRGSRPAGSPPFIWEVRCRTPQATYPEASCGPHARPRGAPLPAWSCSGWGLPHASVTARGRGLLPHAFTLARRLPGEPEGSLDEKDPGGLLSVALSRGRPRSGFRTTLPCGARTFLRGAKRRTGGGPATWSCPPART